ncbi:MAG: hypothetical protein JRI23_24595, partial [Deltaproteobacteria bacterium]|nr:hypothetical protein [Deltaproteobacteria bacterium]
TCAAIRDKQSSRDGLTIGAAVSFGVAGAALLGTLLYAALGGDSDDRGSGSACVEIAPLGFGSEAGPGVRMRW